MQKVIEFFDGKKTYLGFVAVVVYAALIQFAGVPSDETIWAAIATFTGVSLRLAINKV